MKYVTLVLLLSGCSMGTIPDQFTKQADAICIHRNGVKNISSYFGTKILIVCNNQTIFDENGIEVQ